MNIPKQSLIMPYHSNKDMIKYTTEQLDRMIPKNVEIIIVGNNSIEKELDLNFSSRFKYVKVNESLMYSKTVNLGVEHASGEIVTLCDQDIFSYDNWYSPLLNKLLSSDKIGSVSSKLLNPTNNKIIDFGIEYAKYRIVHTARGLDSNHPLASFDRKVTSTTSATLMLKKKVYQQVGGMDLDMPYCCSDCDIGLKISQIGLENWVVADSVAYHRGSSSFKNGKSSSFSHLINDSHCMFWAKNYGKVNFTIQKYLQMSIQHYKTQKAFAPMYCFINLSSVLEYTLYAEFIKQFADIAYTDIYSYPQKVPHYSTPIQIYDEIPYSFMNTSIPLIYFVEYLPAYVDNQIWARMRYAKNDIFIDIHGNVVPFDYVVQSQQK